MKVVAALLAAAVVLVAVELGMGAWGFGETKTVNPCTARSPSTGDGLDGALQRIVLDGLNGAACELHTTREELVLSLRPSSGQKVKWDSATIERAVRAGLVRAIDAAERRGDVPSFLAPLLREAAQHAPVKFLINGGSRLTDILGSLFP
ncbi:MAG TPA: hypothetical protein VF895_01515 [Gaiellaceae bacterium]